MIQKDDASVVQRQCYGRNVDNVHIVPFFQIRQLENAYSCLANREAGRGITARDRVKPVNLRP